MPSFQERSLGLALEKMGESLAQALNSLSRRNKDEVKQLADLLRSDQSLRTEWAKSVELWTVAADVLESSDPGFRLNVLQFAANLSATHGVSDASRSVVTWFAKCQVPQREEQVMWSVIANLAQNSLNPLSLFRDHLKFVVSRASQLPKTSALALAILCECQDAESFTEMVPALEAIFPYYEQWFESQSPDQQNACEFILKTIDNACKIDSAEMTQFWQLFDTSASTPALQVLDAAVSCGSMPPKTMLLENFREFAKCAMPLFGDVEARSTEIALGHYSRLNTTLRMLTTLCTESLKAEDYRTFLKAGGALDTICRVLAEAQKLPTKSKLRLPNSPNSPNSPNNVLDMHDFPFLKTNAIPLFTALFASDDTPDQMVKDRDFCRESGALAAVLSCCCIDDNNPHQREKAIVAIRCALAGSKRNQDFVASLEAKGVANAADLQAAGMEIELDSGGKPQVKRS